MSSLHKKCDLQNPRSKVSTPIKTTKTPIKQPNKVYEIFKQPKSSPLKKESTIIDLSNSPIKTSKLVRTSPVKKESTIIDLSNSPIKTSKLVREKCSSSQKLPKIEKVNLFQNLKTSPPNPPNQTNPSEIIESHKSSAKSHKSDLTLYIPDPESQDALDFFGLECLEEIFEEPSTPIEKKEPPTPVQKISKILTPVVTTFQTMNTKEIEAEKPRNVSPILCSQKPKIHTKSPVLFSQRKLENPSVMNFDYVSDEELFTEDSLNEPWQQTPIVKDSNQEVFSEEMFNESMNFTELKPEINSDPDLQANIKKDSVPEPVYISDDDLFGDDSLNDELFQVARAVSLREADKNLDSCLKENIQSSPRIVTSPILTQSTRSCLFNQFSSQKNPLNPINSNGVRINGFNKLPETSKFSKLQCLTNKPTKDPPLKVINEPFQLLKESPPKPSTSKLTKPAKKSMFQLKRSNNSEPENISIESVNLEDADSDDASLCDFVRPIRKKLKLSLQKISQNETIDRPQKDLISFDIPVQKTSQNTTNKRSIFQLKKNAPSRKEETFNRRIKESPKKKESSYDDISTFDIPSIKPIRNTTFDLSIQKGAAVTGLDKSNSIEIPNDDVFDLSQFTFGCRKKVLGEKSDTRKVGYSDYGKSIPPPKSKLFKPNRQKHKNDFIEEEAELSGDASSDEECDDDELDSSFVDKDEDHEDALTQADVDMKAHYLQSIKSPIGGKFKIPNLPAIKNREDIYSQIPNDDHDENEYKYDTFCVETGVEIDDELSFLEIAEMKLKKQKRAKKQNKVNKPKSRIRKIEDESSSDEEGVMAEYRQMLLLEQSVRR